MTERGIDFDVDIDKMIEASSGGWIKDRNKKKCPECSSLHQMDARKCSVCGWQE